MVGRAAPQKGSLGGSVSQGPVKLKKTRTDTGSVDFDAI
jgi:hypothetical protein